MFLEMWALFRVPRLPMEPTWAERRLGDMDIRTSGHQDIRLKVIRISDD